MLEYRHLLGRTYDHNERNCYSLVRDFMNDNFGLGMANYAHPVGWMKAELNLFKIYAEIEGFKPTDDHWRDLRPGDLALMSISGSRWADHMGVLLPGNKILHHVINNLSQVNPYRMMWRNTTLAVLRHSKVPDVRLSTTTSDIKDHLLPHVRRALERRLAEASSAETVRSDG
jgi:cell wall-associated NlpC family hydrolase